MAPWIVQEAATVLKQSWRPNTAAYELPKRGARLRHPLRTSHPIYASQSLFSVYVHAAPEFEGFNESSMFYGREIIPSMKAERFNHSLGKLAMYLLEAALYDTQVCLCIPSVVR
jgi:hypothetical protein